MNEYTGEIAAFAGDFEPRGWLLCDGRTLPIAQNRQLFRILGTKYGGDGTSTFGLPKMKDPTAGVRYVVAAQGMLPPPEELRVPWEPDVIGFLVEWNGRPLPPGTQPANGQTLQISDYVELYSVIDNKFGGDQGSGTFGLPRLGGKWIIATSGTYPAGG